MSITSIDNHEVVAELVAMDDEAFAALVNVDTRRRSAPNYHAALRDPAVIRRWYTALQQMHKSVENQIAAKAAESNAKVLRMETVHENAMRIKSEKATFESWRAGALRVKSGLDAALIECRSILQQGGDIAVLDQTTKDRDRAFGRIGVLERAIRMHRDTFLAEGDEPSDLDKMLWQHLTDV